MSTKKLSTIISNLKRTNDKNKFKSIFYQKTRIYMILIGLLGISLAFVNPSNIALLTISIGATLASVGSIIWLSVNINKLEKLFEKNKNKILELNQELTNLKIQEKNNSNNLDNELYVKEEKENVSEDKKYSKIKNVKTNIQEELLIDKELTK